MTQAEARLGIRALLQSRQHDLVTLSHAIHDDPEIRFEEHRAAARLVTFLRDAGFSVEAPYGSLPTAFSATLPGGKGTSGPKIAVLCEYDALEGLGHACGHNLIATMGVGAALALIEPMRDVAGELVVIGCPAEEGGGGKAYLLDDGAFDGVDAALMIHPLAEDRAGSPMLARVGWDIEFTGKPAHAAFAPHEGVNALDAVRLTFAGLDAWRQQLPDDVRIHGIITHGGDAANVIPANAAMRLMVRCSESEDLWGTFAPRARDIVQGAALMTGCQVELRDAGPAYENMRGNPVLEDRYAALAAALGRVATPSRQHPAAGSTDMGNVSHRIPALHAFLAIDDEAQPHTQAFATAARSPRADAALLEGAELLACLAHELFTDPALLASVHEAHVSS